jgi:DNA-damage-inducible protein D
MDKQLQALQHNLDAAVQRAMESCAASGHAASDHFRGITKMIVHGKDGLRGVNGEATQ